LINNQEISLLPNERIDTISPYGLKIIQSREVFSFSMDAVLLAGFANVPKFGKIIDLCTGTGVIPLLLSTRAKGKIIGVEIQERLWDMANRSVRLNGMEDQIELVLGDLKEMPARYGDGMFDYLTCNPPYMPAGGDQNLNPHIAIARHEILCTLEDVVRVSSRLVRSGGKVAYVHRPSRLVDLLSLMREYRIEPMRLRLIHPRKDQEANMLLVEGIRDGGKELKLLPPLIVYGEDGEYTNEVKAIYEGFR
jgi:tRNA1(Val) A37 N6-methylase TrmN6